MAFCAAVSTAESVQSELDKNCLRDTWLTLGLGCSRFCKAMSSWSIGFCIGVCWPSSPGS